ncbi:hypothetical protein [Gloeobacter violaceus]|uniref:Glr1773 protein n=1 Tax=Gloeobacter violaceus (strain ATCC 29082 / PCC 7421) TaxID=251221 RepID=Q7NJQ9_GLOVI|nr:hypothetical protein [Gloeobacter violaceus]BAC89714.1 glr1773 [Gloeobacter violaceus PCC 7421]
MEEKYFLQNESDGSGDATYIGTLGEEGAQVNAFSQNGEYSYGSDGNQNVLWDQDSDYYSVQNLYASEDGSSLDSGTGSTNFGNFENAWISGSASLSDNEQDIDTNSDVYDSIAQGVSGLDFDFDSFSDANGTVFATNADSPNSNYPGADTYGAMNDDGYRLLPGASAVTDSAIPQFEQAATDQDLPLAADELLVVDAQIEVENDIHALLVSSGEQASIAFSLPQGANADFMNDSSVMAIAKWDELGGSSNGQTDSWNADELNVIAGKLPAGPNGYPDDKTCRLLHELEQKYPDTPQQKRREEERRSMEQITYPGAGGMLGTIVGSGLTGAAAGSAAGSLGFGIGGLVGGAIGGLAGTIAGEQASQDKVWVEDAYKHCEEQGTQAPWTRPEPPR